MQKRNRGEKGLSLRGVLPALVLLWLGVWQAVIPPLCTAQGPPADYTSVAAAGDLVVRDFRFHDGEALSELHLHYVTWGKPARNAAGEITNAMLLLHGTMGTGFGWGHAAPLSPAKHPLLGPGGPLDVEKCFVIAPDTIGSGKSSRPSDGLRTHFPHYNLEDIAAAERLVAESLGVHHFVAVLGGSMGGRQAWQWGVQYPDWMDALVPMISSPFPNSGRRGLIDLLPVAIIKNDPAWNQGNYSKNPDSVRLAAMTYGLFSRTATAFDHALPTRDAVEKQVNPGQEAAASADANDFIYQLELNNGYDAWSEIDRIHCPVLMINMRSDLMVPVELLHAQKVTERLKNATYLEITEEGEYGHGALGRTSQIWGPTLKAWLENVRKAP
jgi:homoserine O-acetyltransferase/O-succinyltransferase